MKESDFSAATAADRGRYVTRPHQEIPVTMLVEGSNSHLVRGSNVMLSFLTMKAGSVFELHSHPEEQIMVVLQGYCDEVIEDKDYPVGHGRRAAPAPQREAWSFPAGSRLHGHGRLLPRPRRLRGQVPGTASRSGDALPVSAAAL